MTTDADFDAALDEAIRSTGIERYRHLTSEANTLPSPNSREDWRRFIAEKRYTPSDHPIAVDYAQKPATSGRCCG
jgi:hypothetical protein